MQSLCSNGRATEVRIKIFKNYRKDLEKREGCGVVAHERLIEPRVTME